jgi:3-methylcrotonyl-CoA carboxylase alpha subunit
MRIVENTDEFIDALGGAKREAMNAFSNDKVLLEKYITNPRHIEVQLVSDGHGNHLHFFERECSIQRRYQKVVEETPSPALDEDLRKRICETAVKISTGINYLGAGTIELILAPDNSFYFLEMNTRLQVEHPITEMVTGVDLVELQLLAAAGEKFSLKQSDIKQTGHSIEVRIYAEDPDNDFLPTIGKIKNIGFSKEENVRLDCGFADNTQISVNYDPMIAKLIVWDENRDAALQKMDRAIDDIKFTGVKTNRDYLKRILRHPKFIEGDVHTHFIKDYAEDLKKIKPLKMVQASMIAAALFSENNEKKISGKADAWKELTGFRNL